MLNLLPMLDLMWTGLIFVDLLSAKEAALGGKVGFKTVDGEIILTIPPEQSGQQLRLKGKGLPTTSDSNGNMLVTLKIVNPPSLSDAERKAYESCVMRPSLIPVHLRDVPVYYQGVQSELELEHAECAASCVHSRAIGPRVY